MICVYMQYTAGAFLANSFFDRNTPLIGFFADGDAELLSTYLYTVFKKNIQFCFLA